MTDEITPRRRSAKKAAPALQQPRQKPRRAATVTKLPTLATDAPPVGGPAAPTGPAASTPPATGGANPPVTISFLGRQMPVRLPNATQLAVWNNLAARSQRPNLTEADASHLLGKIAGIVLNLIADDSDRSLVENMMIEAQLDLTRTTTTPEDADVAADILYRSVEAHRAAQQTPAPTTGPVARRRN